MGWKTSTSALFVSALFCTTGLGQIGSERAAQSIETVAGLDLLLNEPVTPSDYRVAMYLLEMAGELDPSNTDIARSVIESAWMAGDHESMIRATRTVVRNEPGDTVAQLRLISAIINREQTVESRVEAYERFTNEQSTLIDASVQSRLLLDLALLQRERGNDIGFLSALRRSAKLDTSNKEAQSLVAQHYAHKIKDSATRMRLQLRVLYADPLDPHIHISIAKMCAAEGATDAAWRFLNSAIRIFQIDTGNIPPQLQEQQLSLLWQYEGPQAILDQLNPSLKDERETLQAKIDARIAASEPINDLKTPEEIRYEPGIDRIRLLAAFILDDQETVDSVLLDLQRGLIDYFETAKEAMKQRGSDRGLILGAYLKEVVTFQTMRAIVGVDEEIIRKDMNAIVENSPELEQFFRPFEPFSQYAAGEYQLAKDSAMGSLSRSASRDLLIALASERLGESAESVEIYTQLTLDYPLVAVGAYARTRLKELTGKSELATPQGELMSKIARGVPGWFDKMITNPENTMSLSISPMASTFGPGQRARVEIKLANLSAIPLSIGNSHPIDSNFLIIPGFRKVDSTFLGIAPAKVIDLSHRLRLEPLEEISFIIDPDSIVTRWLLDSQPQSEIRQRWRGLQGFKPHPSGGLINSPFALVSETPLVARSVLGEASSSYQDIARGFQSSDHVIQRRAIQAAAAVLYRPELRPDLGDSDLTSLVEHLWSLYESSDTPTRIWMLGMLPTQSTSSAMGLFNERVQQLMTSDSLIDPGTSPALLAMALMTRVHFIDSPLIEIAHAHTDRRLGWLADRLVERIEGFEPMYAEVDKPFEVFAPTPEEQDRLGL